MSLMNFEKSVIPGPSFCDSELLKRRNLQVSSYEKWCGVGLSLMSYVNTSWVWDPSWVLYALEQPKMIRSHDYKSTNVMYNFVLREALKRKKHLWDPPHILGGKKFPPIIP